MILKDDTKQTIKFIIWVVIIAIAIYIASILIFFKAGSNKRINDQKVANLARQKTPIVNVKNYYHLDRGTNSYALKGSDKKGKLYYFVYLPNSKKAFIYQANKGVSESKIKDNFISENANKTIKSINLGWYQNKPVWEIAYQNPNGKLGYNLYLYRTGKAINQVDNL